MGKCSGCGRKRDYAQMTLHTDHRYYGRCCISTVNGELADALAENKWDHEFDPRPNKWWPDSQSSNDCHNPVCPLDHPHAPYSRALDDERF